MKALQSGKSVLYTLTLPEDFEAVGVRLTTHKNSHVKVRFANGTPFKDGIQYFK